MTPHVEKARAALDRLRAEGITMAAAESCTGGLLTATLTEVPGCSEFVDCAFVTYSNASKQEMLGLDAALIDAHGAVSEPVARAMAEAALARSRAGLAVSITGVAGPGPSERKPEGRVCFACARSGRETRVLTRDFGPLGREAVRQASVEQALDLVIDACGG